MQEQWRREHQEREDLVRKLADETGVEVEYSRAFLTEYELLVRPRNPAVIDPRGVEFIQVQAPLYGSAYLIKNYLYPFTGVGTLLGGYEAVTGRDLLTGERLETWQRVLGGVVVILPFVGGAVAGAIRVSVAAVSRAAKEMAGLARAVGWSARAGLRLAGKLARLPADKVRALLQRVEAARAAKQGLRLLPDELRVAGKVDDAIKSLESGAAPGSRTASGLIDGGRAVSRTQSGTIGLKASVAPQVAGVAGKALSKAAQSLVTAGYSQAAIRALEEMGVKVTARLAGRLKALGDTGRDFVNLFYQSKGFHRVVAEMGRGASKQIGAEFVMRFATQHPDILAKVRNYPLLVAFEWGAGIKKSRWFGDIFAREIDIVVYGDSTVGVSKTIYHELKSYTAKTLAAASRKNVPRQFVRDSALLDPHHIRWVFNSAKIADRAEIIDVFVRIIQRDAYLSAKWGTDRPAIARALDRVIVTFP